MKLTKASPPTDHHNTPTKKRAFASYGIALVIIAAALTPEIAMAAPWDDAGEKVLAIFTNGLSRTLAIIAVTACGVMAFFGKLSWDWAIKIIIGIVLVFGAPTIVSYFG
jgi:type IV secretory pathway VirB2 component (pilin)